MVVQQEIVTEDQTKVPSWQQMANQLKDDQIDPKVHTFKPDIKKSQERPEEDDTVFYKRYVNHMQSIKNDMKKPKKKQHWYYETLNEKRQTYRPIISPISQRKMKNIDYVPPDRQYYPKYDKKQVEFEEKFKKEQAHKVAPKMNEISDILTSP